LIVVAPETVAESQSDKGVVAHGDALIVDPGCSSRFHQEVMVLTLQLEDGITVVVHSLT